MSTVSSTGAEPAQEPSARFGAFRGKIPLPWVTVAVLAILMAAADPYPELQARLVAYARR